MVRCMLIWCVYLYLSANTYASDSRTHLYRSQREDHKVNPIDRIRRTIPLIIPHLSRPHHHVPDKVEQPENYRAEEACIAPGKERGRCVAMEECVIRRINNDYVKYKGYFCIQRQQRSVGVCCPNSIQTPERYSDGMFAAPSSQVSVVIPSPPDNRPTVNSIVSVPDTDTNEIQGSLETLGEPAICGRNGKKVSRIVGGTKATVKDWPWMAAMIRRSDYVQFCGGAIFTKKHIITAAHCVAAITEKDVIVRLGEHDLTVPDETKPEDFNVVRIIRHEDYSNTTYRHDIAILELDKAIRFNFYMQPVCLPPPGPRFANITAVVTGWGTISFGGPASAVLLEVPVPVWEQDKCVKSYAQTIYDTCLCAAAYEGGKDSCQGDSGGPLTMQREDGRWAIIGIVSWGNGCARKGAPGIYTRVNDYLIWIAENIQ